ncbi:MAG: DUF1015 domain-containing protein [Phycisphaerae bacterium]
MLEIRPFQALRYDFERGGDISALIAPPYDVLNQADKDALLGKSQHNIVAIDLPHLPPKSAGPARVYAQAARTLEAWLGDGALIRERQPALYLYHQAFEHGGTTYTRRKFIARVRLAAFAEGTILPHEQTFGGPKEDRLALMKATRCQLSPIFGLYADRQDVIGQAFSATSATPPHATGTLGGVQNRVWVVDDATVIGRVACEMAGKKVYIADGHHRYGTALMYRDWCAGQQGGSLPPDHPANYVMFVLASMDDPGCLILPYYRALVNVTIETLLDRWQPGVGRCAAGDADLTLHAPTDGSEVALRFTNRDVLKTLSPNQPDAWYDLDYAYLHRYLIDELLGNEAHILYAKSEARAKEAAATSDGVALLVKATPMAQLRAVSEAGGLMPQKSTYFYPKLATGIAINPLSRGF